jgi:tetraacyldisaccharide 4'-kinase
VARWPACCFPFSLIFQALVAARRVCYRIGMLHARAPAGTGGRRRQPERRRYRQDAAGDPSGVGARARADIPGSSVAAIGGDGRHVAEVTGDSDPKAVGDEPLLLAQRSLLPGFVGRDRVAAARRCSRRIRNAICSSPMTACSTIAWRGDVELALIRRARR